MKQATRQFLLCILNLALLGLAAVVGAQEQSRDLVMTRSKDPAGLPIYTGSHALIVGVDKYPNLPKTAQLKYAVNDADGIKQTLVDFYGFPESNVTVLTNEKATLANILQALDQLSDRSRIRADDRILIYFSGHGQTVRDSAGVDRGFLIPTDAKIDFDNPTDISAYEKTCLPMQEVWNRLDASPAKHVAVIADACFSGLLTRARGFWEENPLAAYLTMPARQAIAAGGKGQKTWETDEYKHGVFTFNLLTELRKRAKEKNYVFSMLDLFASIQDPVVRMSKGRQIPQINQFFTEGQMLFFASGDKKVPDGPPVGTGTTTNPSGNKKPEIAKLTVRSNPEGAKVFINGEEVGVTTFRKDYELEKSQKIKVRLELEGYEPREKEVELKPKKETKIDEKLKKLKLPDKPKPAKLTIITSPAGAVVSVDGEEVGTSPLEKEIEVPAKATKTVTVKASLTGYETQERQVELTGGRESKLSITLVKEPEKPKKATLTINSEPKGASVTIDGVPQGKTPLVYEQEILAPVSVSIKVSLTGYETVEQTATLDASVPSTISLTLKKQGTTVPPKISPIRLSPKATISHSGPIRSLVFSPDGSKAAITGQDNAIFIYDTATGGLIKQIKEPVTSFVRLSSDWKSLLYINLYLNGNLGYASVMVQDMADPKIAKVYSAAMGNSTALNFANSSNGVLVLCGQGAGGTASIAMIDLATGKSDSFQVSGRLQGAMVAPDGSSVSVFKDPLTSGIESSLLLLRGPTREDQQQLRLIDSNVGQGIFYSQTSDVVAVNAGIRGSGSAQTQKGMKVFETRNGQMKFSSVKHVALGFMAGGTRLLAWSEAQGGSIELFDSVSGASLGSTKSARPWLSMDGRWMAVPTNSGLQITAIDPVK